MSVKTRLLLVLLASSLSGCGDGQIVSAGASPAGTTGGGSGASTGGATTSGGNAGTGSGSTSGGASGNTTGGACTADTWANYAQGWFTVNCAVCHSSLTTYAAVSASKASIQSAIASGLMPQGATLSQAERDRIGKWISCGLPQ